MPYMRMKAKIFLNEDCYNSILMRIFERAFEDYVKAVINDNPAMKKDCERFFASDYAQELASGNWQKHGKRLKEGALKFKELTDKYPQELVCPQCHSKINIYKYKRTYSYMRYSCPKCYMVRTIRVKEEEQNG